MKVTIFASSIAVIALLGIVFLNPKTSEPTSEHQGQTKLDVQAGVVSFSNSDVSIVPGDGWYLSTPVSHLENQNYSVPVLKADDSMGGGMIKVFATTNAASIKRAANILKTNILSNPNTIKGSFVTNAFEASELAGIEVSYEYKNGGLFRADKFKVHIYLFQNKKRNCVAINYTTFADKDSEVVGQMIRNTIKLN